MLRSVPRILTAEGLAEIEDVVEFVAAVRRLAHQQAEVDQGEDHVANVAAAPHPPVLQDEARHDAVALKGQVPAGERKLASAYVPALFHALLLELERREHEEIRAFVEPLLLEPDAVHDPVAKRQLCHSVLGVMRIHRRSNQATGSCRKNAEGEALPQLPGLPLKIKGQDRAAENQRVRALDRSDQVL